LGANGLFVTVSATQAINAASSSAKLYLISDQSYSTATGGLLTINAPIENLGHSLTISGSAAAINGAISGAGGLIVTGAGTVTLPGPNSYTGATRILAGAVNAASSTAFGDNGDVTIAAGAAVNVQGIAIPGAGLFGRYYNSFPSGPNIVDLSTLMNS